MRIRAAVLFCLFAGIASAQSTIRPGGGGGSSTITAGTTATSGCVAGGVLRSISNLVQCGAGLTIDSAGATTIGSSSLGTTVVPLTIVRGTGSTVGAIDIPDLSAYQINGTDIVKAQTTLGNSYFGKAAGNVTGTGTYNIAVGGYRFYGTAIGLTSGSYNVVMGTDAGAMTTGSYNVGVGYGVLGGSAYIAITGLENTAMGYVALSSISGAGSYNQAFGGAALYNLTTGTYNTAIGFETGWGITTGGKNTIVGSLVKSLPTTLSNNIILADGDGQQRHRQFAPVTLTEAGGAETVLTLTSATTNTFTVDVDYMVTAKDATPDYATRKGSVGLVCVNNATAVTCTASATSEANDGRNGGGSLLINTNAKTLTYAIGVDVATANVAKLTFNIDSDMTVTAASITMTVTINGTVTPS